jgi:hypothetical protein
MIPRGTRTRPILKICTKDGVLVYTNNINSPEKNFHPCFFTIQQSTFRINAVTCCVTRPEQIVRNFGGCQFDIRGILVEFWSRNGVKLRPLLSVVVRIPLHWTLEQFLLVIEESVDDCRVNSLLNTYTIRGITFPFITINSVHERYNE